MNVRLAGFGGQGIVMAGYILGHAGLLDGGNVVQTQSYGSESRGGQCNSDVIISQEEILDLVPSGLEVLVAMSQPALEKYLLDLKPGGVLLFDSDLVEPGRGRFRAFGLPATVIAEKTFARDVVANTIMLGCMVAITGVVTRDALRKAIAESVPAKAVEINLGAFEEGLRRGHEARRHWKVQQQRRGAVRPRVASRPLPTGSPSILARFPSPGPRLARGPKRERFPGPLSHRARRWRTCN